MVTASTMQREQVLGGSRLDFLVNGRTYIEVKTPLDNLQVIPGGHIQTRPRSPLDSTGRLVPAHRRTRRKPRRPPARRSG